MRSFSSHAVDKYHRTFKDDTSAMRTIAGLVTFSFALLATQQSAAETPLVNLTSSSVIGEQSSEVTFYAMGDVPYAPNEDLILPKQIEELPLDGRFLIHLGDIKSGASPCAEEVYIKVSSMLRKAKSPTFIIPGDNEWNDCTSPNVAWKYWMKHFHNFDKNWEYDFEVKRQKARNENFSFRLHRVLFVGINLVGGRVHDEAEWKIRHAQNVAWLTQVLKANQGAHQAIVLFGHAHPIVKHNDFFTPFVDLVEKEKLPVLYLHGDGHKWIKDKPFGTELITRVQVDQGGLAPPLKITVKPALKDPFVFDRRLSPAQKQVLPR